MSLNLNHLQDLVARAVRSFDRRVVAVYLFGSMAEGDATPSSDIDLAALLDPSEKSSFFDLRMALYAALSRALKTNAIDLTILNTLDNLFILDDILRRGRLLYETQSDLRQDFEQRMLHQAIDFKEQRLRVMGI